MTSSKLKTPSSDTRARLRRSLQIALVVGPALIAINHFDDVVRGRWGALASVKSLLTIAVPFVVSWHAGEPSARAARSARAADAARESRP